MSGTILFVHGTGAREVSETVEAIRDRVSATLGWPRDSVVAVEWGRAVGPADLDVGPALPPEDATRSLVAELTPAEEEAAVWELLIVDPLAELRVLAEVPNDAASTMIPTATPPDVDAAERITALEVDPAVLEATGFDGADVDEAKRAVVSDPALGRAATAAGSAREAAFVEAAARALTASMLHRHLDAARRSFQAPSATAFYDAVQRDALVAALEAGLEPTGGRGFGFLKSAFARVATRIAMSKRASLMDPLTDFVRDITYYIRRGNEVRDYIATAVRSAPDGPVVLLAHSLGGIAAVDLLSDPAVMEGPEPLKVDLLVTVGSQAPLLYLMDSLTSMSPRGKLPAKPFVPWLNVYDRQDLLSFCASRVFVNATGIADEPISSRVPFPMSHSAYFEQDRLYELIEQHLPA